MSCEYCQGKKPLTDKVYDDGSKFDDQRHMGIEKMGKFSVICAEIKASFFDNWEAIRKVFGLAENLGAFNKYCTVINYCPKCGERLNDEAPPLIRLPDLKEGQDVYVVDKAFGASKIKKLQVESFSIRYGVLLVHLFAHGFNWAIRPEDIGTTAFLNIYDAEEKAKEI